MCGIAGIVASHRRALHPIAAMTAALRHRGPDDEGFLIADTGRGLAFPHRGPDTAPELTLAPLPAEPPDGADLAFGHRRLAILDLSAGGHGPMASPDGRLWITYNGEIFNYLELRDELRALGHEFRTGSDTEVLLAAYAQWGPGALHRLNGMWAFAVYDIRQNVVFCARDRFGVKPFHYSWDGRLFVFGSEIKAVLAHPGVRRVPHDPTVLGFLVDGQIDEGDQTFFDGIRSLPGGHLLTLQLGPRRLDVERWYSLPEPAPRAEEPGELRRLLADAVRLRLRSDVDVGTCLSGGLDSSAIVALTAQLRGAEAAGRHRSFSVVYHDAGLDESIHVDAVVGATGVVPSRATPTAAELLRDLPGLVRHQDEPFPSAAVYSQWRVMGLARQAGVKVLLDGQGADEVLAGYHYHFGPFLAEVARRRGLTAALREVQQARAITGHSLGFFLGLLAYHRLALPAALRTRLVGRFSTQRRVPLELIDRGFAAAVCRPAAARHVRRTSLTEELRANLTKTSLPALLRYEDRNSMAFSVEARTPYLDYRLVERALAIPAADLIRDGWTKAPLRAAMAGVLPESVRLRRDKLGFATPEARWLREMIGEVRGWLGPGSRLSGRLDAPALGRWLRQGDDALARQPGLWRLVSLELWLRFAERPNATAP